MNEVACNSTIDIKASAKKNLVKNWKASKRNLATEIHSNEYIEDIFEFIDYLWAQINLLNISKMLFRHS